MTEPIQYVHVSEFQLFFVRNLHSYYTMYQNMKRAYLENPEACHFVPSDYGRALLSVLCWIEQTHGPLYLNHWVHDSMQMVRNRLEFFNAHSAQFVAFMQLTDTEGYDKKDGRDRYPLSVYEFKLEESLALLGMRWESPDPHVFRVIDSYGVLILEVDSYALIRPWLFVLGYFLQHTEGHIATHKDYEVKNALLVRIRTRLFGTPDPEPSKPTHSPRSGRGKRTKGNPCEEPCGSALSGCKDSAQTSTSVSAVDPPSS